MDEDVNRRRKRRLMLAATFGLAVALALAGAWRFTPLTEYADPERLGGWLQRMRSSPWTFLVVPALYIAANLVLFPNTILNAATILGFGTRAGLPLALGSSVLAATVLYVGGRCFGAQRLRKLDVEAVERVRQALRRCGILGIAALRLLPVAPFGLVNAMAGACRVKLYVFVSGTALGLLPGNLLVTAFGHQLRKLISHPAPREIALMLALLAFAALAGWWLRQRAMMPAEN